MRIALVYNERLVPRRLKKIQALARVLERRGHSVAHHFGDHFDAARDAPDAECLCLCGGDGTARLVIGNQSDPGKLPPIAIYPMGTINLLARELGYSRQPRKFAARLERDQAKTLTRMATVSGTPFLACASIGFDAFTVASVSEALKLRIGRLAYVAALLTLVHKWPKQTLHLRYAEGEMRAEALFVLRGRYYAGPWTLDPAAHLGTKSLRVLALPQARRRDLALLVLYAMLGSRKPHGHWRFFETNRLTVSNDNAVPVQADGDVIAATPAEFELSPAQLTFL